MSKFGFKKLFACALGLAVFMAALPEAKAVTIEPPSIDVTVNPGETLVRTVRVMNEGSIAQTFYPYAQNFTAGNESGTPYMYSPDAAPESASAGKWLKFSEEGLTLEPKEKKEVEFSIEVPSSAEPGGHYAMLVFGTKASNTSGLNQTSTQVGVALVIRITVRGDIAEGASLLTFGSYALANTDQVFTSDFSPENTSWFYESLPATFVARFQNTGNVHYIPRGSIALSGLLSGALSDVAKEPVYNADGVYQKDELVDVINMNISNGSVLPSSVRAFPVQFAPVSAANDNFFAQMFQRISETGRYTATLTVALPSGEVTQTVVFWVLPWKDLLTVLVALAVVVTLYVTYSRWSKARMRAQLLKEMEGEKGKKKK